MKSGVQATVVYWVTRAAMAKAFAGTKPNQLQNGDAKVIKLGLMSDKALGHVLKELQRIGWIEEQKDALLELVDLVWEKSLI